MCLNFSVIVSIERRGRLFLHSRLLRHFPIQSLKKPFERCLSKCVLHLFLRQNFYQSLCSEINLRPEWHPKVLFNDVHASTYETNVTHLLVRVRGHESSRQQGGLARPKQNTRAMAQLPDRWHRNQIFSESQ